jgi:polyphosphate glucokinase
MKFRYILGIDFGGSGIKGAPVDTKSGKLVGDRFRIPTPQPASPEAVTNVIQQIITHFRWEGPVGIAFPAVVQNGVVKTASNIDKAWIGINVSELIGKQSKLPSYVVNDADAAGMAEMKFGAGKGKKGSVLLVTVGTGIGTVLFTRGKLVPNTELGHLFLSSGIEAEDMASDAVRKAENLTWEDWASRITSYLKEMEKLFWPELIILGGGVSKKEDEFIRHIKIQSKLVMAKSKNEAGIIGSALAMRSNRDQFRKQS